jgi:sulfate transport system ATP-binding protein
MTIELRALVKTFGTFTALGGVDLTVRPGEFLALLGPSGSGKTTLLRILSGLEHADSGGVRFFGEDVAAQSARERDVGLVFQHYALFRHMTVFENVAFGLRVKRRRDRLSKAEIGERVERLLRLVQLDHMEDRYPTQLSGGQRQRVALARALAVEPKVLLLDEPFGALDAKVRKELRRWLRDLHDQMGLTSIFVTHDQEEAQELADRVAVMRNGQIEQTGSPREVYERPISPFVFEFIGSANRFQGQVERGTVVVAGKSIGRAANGTADGPVSVYVRPHDLFVVRDSETAGIEAVVRTAYVAGGRVHLELDATGSDRVVEIQVPLRAADSEEFARGAPVRLQVGRFGLFPEQSPSDQERES